MHMPVYSLFEQSSLDVSDMSAMNCKHCGPGFALRIEMREELQAKPLGSFSLAGNQLKFSTIKHDWPWAVCDNCKRESRGTLGDNDMEVLTIWRVFYNPGDYPGKWVLRGFDVKPEGPQPHADCVVADSLAEIRAAVPVGLWPLPRNRHDDPAIYESWF